MKFFPVCRYLAQYLCYHYSGALHEGLLSNRKETPAIRQKCKDMK